MHANSRNRPEARTAVAQSGPDAPNRTRSANEAMSIIARRIAERAAAYLAPADEIRPMCEMVTTFLDQMVDGISSTEASRLLSRMIDRIDFLGDHLLQSVNPPAQRTAFQDYIVRSWPASPMADRSIWSLASGRHGRRSAYSSMSGLTS